MKYVKRLFHPVSKILKFFESVKSAIWYFKAINGINNAIVIMEKAVDFFPESAELIRGKIEELKTLAISFSPKSGTAMFFEKFSTYFNNSTNILLLSEIIDLVVQDEIVKTLSEKSASATQELVDRFTKNPAEKELIINDVTNKYINESLKIGTRALKEKFGILCEYKNLCVPRQAIENSFRKVISYLEAENGDKDEIS